MATIQEQVDFILGPQAPVTDSWFDQTQISMAKKLGAMCPPVPPTDPTALNEYVLHLQYYDLPASEYIVYKKTSDTLFRDYARNAADSWWKHPEWIGEGKVKLWETQGSATPAPRHAGIGGLILRALDGRPEFWDWIVGYTRWNFDIWLKSRINNPALHVGVREGAFMLQYGIWIVVALPDSYPNAAAIRSQFLADVEAVAKDYFGRLQKDDGSWRWDDFDAKDPDDGGTLVGITQPFQIGLLLCALIDVHRLTANSTVKESVKNQILKGCRHLYADGPYRKDEPIPYDPSKRRRSFWYLYHGGTSVNPTRFEKGGGSYPGNNITEIQDERQAIGPVVAAYGYAYLISGDAFFKTAGDELWDSAYGATDGIRNFFNTDGKGYNQNARRAGSYPVWAGTPAVPIPAPVPEPAPSPSAPSEPVSAPSPDGTKAMSIIDSIGAKWTLGPEKQTLRSGTQVGNGAGLIYKYVNAIVHVLGTDNKTWYKWNNSAWVEVGTEPGVITPTPAPTPTPTPVSLTTRKVAWPKTESAQENTLNVQWTERYRLKTTKVTGDFAIFEKVS